MKTRTSRETYLPWATSISCREPRNPGGGREARFVIQGRKTKDIQCVCVCEWWDTARKIWWAGWFCVGARVVQQTRTRQIIQSVCQSHCHNTLIIVATPEVAARPGRPQSLNWQAKQHELYLLQYMIYSFSFHINGYGTNSYFSRLLEPNCFAYNLQDSHNPISRD